MPQGKYFRIGYGIIIFLLIAYLATKVDYLFQPIFTIVRALFFPFLISGVFYYILRPLVLLLEKRRINRSASIIVLYLLVTCLITAVVLLIGPIVQRQVEMLVTNLPELVENFRGQLTELQQKPWAKGLFGGGGNADLTDRVATYLNQSMSTMGDRLLTFMAATTSAIVILSTIPFILFYMLKDGEKVPRILLKWLPQRHEIEGRKILADMDDALSSYIQGQFLVSLVLGVVIFIGYSIIGMEYSLLLAILAMVTNVIPSIGQLIGVIPSIIVAFIHSPTMVLKVIIVVTIAQQIDGNFLSPHIMGRKLDIHPLTIILLLLISASLAGFLGMLLAVPVYAVGKLIVQHAIRLFVLRSRPELQEKG
ncbi:membrane protein [Paenibacillus swuensis]|uniref:Membrane protein n=1 Tax=Paenibacillus swuensis TaxID=1178515 RepID=A0A172TLZ9_9BACL|nr:AI-2E family transporter [Paenibacillus swuensis]ANE48099.1 membrane protein [Paenibacillus swuensis]